MDRTKEFYEALAILEKTGFKENPIRLEYEENVRGLQKEREAMERRGCSTEEIAKSLHEKRRAFGKKYKEAAPPLVREYIYYATAKKYGDPLGPDFDTLKKYKTDMEIIESASRPIRDLDTRLSVEGFREWFKEKNI